MLSCIDSDAFNHAAYFFAFVFGHPYFLGQYIHIEAYVYHRDVEIVKKILVKNHSAALSKENYPPPQ